MLNEDYKEILFTLLAQKTEFILVGAYAMAAHGFPRATMDIDLWIKPDQNNAQKAYQALAIFGAPLDQLTVQDLATAGVVFQIGVAPRRIDILTSITGVEFDEAQKSATLIEIDGASIFVLSVDHLIQNKQQTGRTKDLADVEMLLQHYPPAS